MKYWMPAIRFKIAMTLLLGLLYPFAMTGISQVLFPHEAGGKLLLQDGKVVGSELISQKFEKPIYFWSRPSAMDYNPLPSGGSNLGQISQDLKKIVGDRRTRLKAAHADQVVEPPQDLLFASASGLDPHISLEAAHYQVHRVAQARLLTDAELEKIIIQISETPQLRIFGEPSVNVLKLNLALDQLRNLSK